MCVKKQDPFKRLSSFITSLLGSREPCDSHTFSLSLFYISRFSESFIVITNKREIAKERWLVPRKRTESSVTFLLLASSPRRKSSGGNSAAQPCPSHFTFPPDEASLAAAAAVACTATSAPPHSSPKSTAVETSASRLSSVLHVQGPHSREYISASLSNSKDDVCNYSDACSLPIYYRAGRPICRKILLCFSM